MIGIYKITNPKGKSYIGQSINIEKRFLTYKRVSEEIKEQKKLYNSLKKYGPENHVFEVLEECILEQLNEKETYWIKYFNAINKGLNIREGGIGGKGHIMSPITREKISKALTGKKQSKETIEKRSKQLKGLKRSDEARNNISKGKTGVPVTWGNKIKEAKIENPYVPSEETKLKLRQNNTKPVIQYDLNENKINEFFSAREASRQTGIKPDNICCCLKGKSKTAGGFIWKYKYV